MTNSNRPRGRPKDGSKREALLKAARQLFLMRGVDVTTEEIALEAKVAKATLYANFSDKEELIEAVIRKESDRTVTNEEFEKSRAMPIETALTAFGIRYLNFINQRESLGWDRLIASAAVRNPELARRFFAAGPGRGQTILRNMIASAMDRGELDQADPETAADDLSGLWLGFVNLEVKLYSREPLTKPEIERRVARGIQLFLSLYRCPAR